MAPGGDGGIPVGADAADKKAFGGEDRYDGHVLGGLRGPSKR